jgi:hypothetical protein
MSKQVNGYLANDGSFFENEPECQRYEAERDLIVLCDTHEVNYENFIAMLNAWHSPIGRYYDADDKCKVHQVGQSKEPLNVVGQGANFDDAKGHDDYDIQSDDIPAFLHSKDDRAHPASRDPDAPGFLEQQIRRNK